VSSNVAQVNALRFFNKISQSAANRLSLIGETVA